MQTEISQIRSVLYLAKNQILCPHGGMPSNKIVCAEIVEAIESLEAIAKECSLLDPVAEKEEFPA